MRGLFWIHIYGHGIYTKNRDKSSPKLFYDGCKISNCWNGKALKPFLKETCLLFFSFTHLIIIPIKHDLTPGRVRVIGSVDVDDKKDFAVFQNKVLILTEKKILLIKVVKLKQIKLLSEIKVGGIRGREETSLSMSICNKGRYIMVHRIKTNKASSLLIYEILCNRLRIRNIFDIFKLDIFWFVSMNFLKYCGNRIYFMGMSRKSRKKSLFVFYYDMDSHKMGEEERLRKENIEVEFIFKFVKKQDGEIVGISNKSELLSIKFN